MGHPLIEKAKEKGRKALSEYESKEFLKSFGVPVTSEILAGGEGEVVKAAEKIGYPVVLKACGADITHKTERSLVHVRMRDERDVKEAYREITAAAGKDIDGILVQEYIKGARELIVGLTRDPQFGPCVMFGLGGIFTEVLEDVSFRVAPMEDYDAREMIGEIKAKKILDPFRGEAAVNRDELGKILKTIGKIGLDFPEIAEIDINPLIIRRDGGPVAVDALVALAK